ncbi:MAG: SOS response-associated peptidase [Candidatus Thermoplasmatota archaeon]|nr:SOS response-associated peptidase [Candidatus Thermoplasmatota archaeon]
MCGRFAFQGDQWPEMTTDIEQPVIEPNYNICPQDKTPVIHYDSDKLAITSMQWGLRPSWSKISTMEPINARVETIDSKPMFREGYRQRRCLVPANGWYEWKTTPRGKVPFYHSVTNQDVFLMAGIYEHWGEGEQSLHTFTILTQESIPEIQHIHNRMPVIVNEMEADSWLIDSQQPSSGITIEVHPVDREVNKTTAQGPQLIRPLRTLFD